EPPAGEGTLSAAGGEAGAGRCLPPEVSLPVRSPAPEGLRGLAAACRRWPKGLIVAGPGLPWAGWRSVVTLCRNLGYPLLADGASQLRCPETDPLVKEGLRIDAFDPLFSALPAAADSGAGEGGWAAGLEPELVLQLGRAPTSGAWSRTVRGWASRDEVGRGGGRPEQWVIGPHGFFDAENSATRVLVADLGPALEGLLAELGEGGAGEARSRDPDRHAWLELWRRAGAAASRAVEGQLGTAEEEDDLLSEARLARQASRSVPAVGLLAVGNSLPIRLLDVYGTTPAPGVTVLSQRGASGIDGLVSGAAGAAVASGRPTLVYLGDVSLIHDLGGLATVPRAEAPFVVLVAQNRGGRIFEQLPVASHPAARGQLEHWTTPRAYDLAHAAELFGLRYRRASTVGALGRALHQAFAAGGAWLVEAEVPPHAAAEASRRLRQRLASELAVPSGAASPPSVDPSPDPSGGAHRSESWSRDPEGPTVGDAPPRVLLHGFTGAGRSWDATRLHMPDHPDVWAPDLPGHG
ncbi:MAG: thiamine pyrophosphate-dependent enzyme, partial [Holophagales bacterium]|nr:thiamine pyrophosphate-dependent enzyme [Holophagales bacterium]